MYFDGSYTIMISARKRTTDAAKFETEMAEMAQETKLRDSNLELYRILLMLLIIAHHYVVNSGLLAQTGPLVTDPTAVRSVFLYLFGAFGKTGINCFLMITGYYMCKSRITLQRFLKVFLEVLFYDIACWIVFVIAGYETFSVRGLLSLFIPVKNVGQNFVGCFLVFYLFLPFLTILVQNLTQKMHLALLALTGYMYVVLGNLPGCSVTMNYVSWYMVIFFMASYLRLYPSPVFFKKGLWAVASLGSLALSLVSVVICGRFFDAPYMLVSDTNALLAVTNGVTWFLFFKNLRIPYTKWINTVASTTFGVLLIHANSDAMRRFLWEDLLKNTQAYATDLWWLHAVLSVLGIFAVCVVIDLLRQCFAEKPAMAFVDKALSRRSS